tara:strand:- start:716 stop:3043 length:2328 start_codon:yes stop_codon:yes gene_type:complete
MATYNFTGANGDPLPAGLTAAAGTFEIQSNALAVTGAAPAGGSWICTQDSTADGTSAAILKGNGGSGSGGPLFRYTDPDNHLAVRMNSTSGYVAVFKKEAGVGVQLGNYTIAGFNTNTTYQLQTVLSGSSIIVNINGTQRINVADTFNQTATIRGYITNSAIARLDTLAIPNAIATNTLTTNTVDVYIQRVSGNITATVSGTYTGTPANIERKVIYTDDLTTVSGFDWATYITGPTGNTFTGAAIVLPESPRQYRVDLRFSNDTGVTDSTNGFNTADKWLVYGQSLGEQLSSVGTDITPNSLAKYADPVSGVYSTPTIGNGSTQLLNDLVSETGFAQVAVNAAMGAMALLEVNESTVGNFLWDSTDPDTVRYLEVKAAILAVGTNIAGAVYVQGERDATGGFNLNTYESSLAAHFAQLRADTRADLPIIISPIGRATGGGDEDNWELVKQAQITIANNDANIFYTLKYDLPLADTVHLTGAGYTSLGQRLANNAITNILGGSADWQSPTIASIEAVTTTSTRVNLTQGQGTDFTPTTGITGIELTETGDGYGVTGITAARETAASILVTHDAATVTAGRLYFGAAPVITGVVLDNSTLNLPITPETLNVTFRPSGAVAFTIGAPTFVSTGSVTLPQPSGDINFSIGKPAFSVVGAASLPFPQGNINFSIDAPTFNAVGSVTLPAATGNIDFAIDAPTFAVAGSVTIPQPSGDIDFAIGAPVFNVAGSVTLPQPSGNVDFSISTPLFSVFGTVSGLEIPLGSILIPAFGSNVIISA